MPIPVYLWLKDDAGNDIKGSVDVRGRENSIEVSFFSHDVSLPTDNHTGRITRVREHMPILFEKEIDASSTYLYKALTTGQRLQSAEFIFYRINYAGKEEAYFTVQLENVHVVAIGPGMYDTKSSYGEQRNHLEFVELHYEKIIWRYLEGNITHADSWNNRESV